MKGKWTSGEWRVGHNGMCVVSDCDEGLHIGGSTGADAIEYYGGNLIAESVIKDNAHLISAAPDMAAAVMEAIADYESCVADVCEMNFDWIEKARAALRKARGE